MRLSSESANSTSMENVGSHINFSGNDKVSQVGAVQLANALKDNQGISKINMHGLKLGKHGAKVIMLLVSRIIELIICSGTQ